MIQLEFDPSKVSYREILETFFAIHDPTTRDRQGNDHGPQYRSAIFWHDEAQRETAREVIANLTAERAFDDPIVTEVTKLDRFYPAELPPGLLPAKSGSAVLRLRHLTEAGEIP